MKMYTFVGYSYGKYGHECTGISTMGETEQEARVEAGKQMGREFPGTIVVVQECVAVEGEAHT